MTTPDLPDRRAPEHLQEELFQRARGLPGVTMMLFGPRDDDELELAGQILQASWRWAHTGPTSPTDED